MNKIDTAVEKCTENFILTMCSECPRKKMYNSTKLCRDDLINTIWKENKRLEKENKEYSELVSKLHNEIKELQNG